MKKKMFLYLLMGLTIAFIWGQSTLPQKESIAESTTVEKAIVQPIHKALSGDSSISVDIRKVAHIAEFAILGIGIGIGVAFDITKVKRKYLCAISYSGLIAFIDETIQYANDRGPEVRDIWLDILGATIGVAVVMLCMIIKKRIIRNSDNMTDKS